MNKEYILYNLKEAQNQLISIINDLSTDGEYNELTYFSEMRHVFHHLNTAWNARNSTKEESIACSEENFNKWRDFPQDLID